MKKQLKALRRAIRKADSEPFLYKKEELDYMKLQEKNLTEIYKRQQIENKGGFGQYVR